MQGKVKFFNDGKGWGFIKTNDGKEYFFHISQVQEKLILMADDLVTFNLQKKHGKMQAINIIPMEV